MLDPDSVNAFSAHSARTLYPQDTELVAQGDSCDRVGVIASGLIKLQTLTESGEEHLLQVLRSGQLLSVARNAPSRFSWQTATASEICWMPQKAWESFLTERPQHFQSYMKTTLYQLEQMQLFLINMRGRSTLQRVALWLVEELLNGPEIGAALHVQLSRRDLASLLDMTVETLCRSLRQLQDGGAIRLPKPDRVEIADFTKLQQMAGCSESGAGDIHALPPRGRGQSRGADGWRNAEADNDARRPASRGKPPRRSN
ncbi:Crp/Fnr family transcriptional regulator [Salipiger sp. PrR002]|uniref:Crp/Fnr family transcriptional regulator n=1 Tax=Salipiger sp. PrR002 TaxID=2706489 RepID=UPI0013B9128F|nr:Crp/Fnr family transcriptional regulator [Salipiger sp. PrR002]NDV97973.1 Crp/Fnr family transcriptional regulator [Salipiger sp. PrR002]NDW56948.1 Crp/Fnr family transcriptional regulator [Salipiger sp. PrR004]